jgi:acetolactate synthase small subunit
LAEDRQRNIEKLRQKEAELLSRVGELDGQLQQARDEVNQHAAVAAAEYVTSNKALEEENQMLLEELHKVQEELEANHIQNQLLLFKVQQAEEKLNPKLRGAANLIKQDLPYRLGSAVVRCPQSIPHYLALPRKLQRITKDFKDSQVKLSEQRIPCLLDFEDRHEAERVKQHLSYRFGEVLVKAGGNPFHWLLMPYKLKKAHSNWRMSRA